LKRIVGFSVSFAAAAIFFTTAYTPVAQAENLLNWLEGATGSYRQGGDSIQPDGAELVTLEDRQNEMYPKVSPDGKYFLVVSSQKRKPVISRRLVENGDPINIVSDYDPQALDSIAWRGNADVTFLSHRADSLGIWQKPVDGGVIRRLHGRLDGELRDPIVLDDDSIIAVRLQRLARNEPKTRVKKKNYQLGFDNWEYKGQKSHLVKIDKGGAESILASGVNPAVSPDGKRVVFTMQAGRSWHLFVMSVDGSELVELTEGRSIDVQPAWSADGQWVAFTSNRSDADMRHPSKGNWDVWMVGQDGRNLVRLTTDKARDGAPSFAKNGRVYFHSDRKVSKQKREYHQVSGSNKGFHIWSVLPPMMGS